MHSHRTSQYSGYDPGRASLNNGDLSDDGDGPYNEQSRLLSGSASSPHTSGLNGSQQGVPDPQENSVEVDIVNEATATQNSIVTIFSMWNTMMGTSLLSMPWAIKQAGFVNGIVLLIVMAGIMAYTSYRVLNSGRLLAGRVVTEFSDVVRVFLGRFAEVGALLCSLLTLLGGAIVYWILMSNFLYHIVVFIYSHVHQTDHHNTNSSSNYSHPQEAVPFTDVLCRNLTKSDDTLDSTFTKVWNETNTVPFFLVLILFPLLNFKSPTFFTKFNALGTLSVTYLSIFVAVKAGEWGIHLDLNSDHSAAYNYAPAFEWSFPALTGIAALAYFLQNCVMAICRNQKHPENNTRDLIIAYVLVCLTYTYMGAVFFAAYPMAKSCIEDNFLNNMASTDVMAFVARMGLFFQMMCVLPLLTYVFRAQLLHFLFRSVWPSVKHVLVLNLLIVGVCVIFAVFMPKIGHIISFVGAFCGFSYAIAFPCTVYLVACYRDGSLTVPKLVFHGALIALGLANFVAQFVIIGHTS
ncbi:sodium-coupled neutral amino acid transporter 9 [Aplysia californica]|uniref:Sodium-coupled neutral amino acid transporter 9 n=1 Tax=Aplysia californica TaxID=6500 RepID=A0ABM1A4B6_APLCA|nr:sodium-coupled neutral amino acid transporter 9 [Aplysia californica]